MAKIVINSCLENMSKSAHIPTVQDTELERLNVAVYNNDDLEQKVAKDFDIRQSKGVVDAAEAQIKTINEKLDIVNKKVEDCESSLQRVCETGGFNSRKCRSLLNEQEKLSTTRADLLERRCEVQVKLDKAFLVMQLASNDEPNRNEDKNTLVESKDSLFVNPRDDGNSSEIPEKC